MGKRILQTREELSLLSKDELIKRVLELNGFINCYEVKISNKTEKIENLIVNIKKIKAIVDYFYEHPTGSKKGYKAYMGVNNGYGKISQEER